MTHVVAALVRAGDRFLICQRPAHKTRGLLWEFVGGKVEPGETGQQALVRECREELDADFSAYKGSLSPSWLQEEIINIDEVNAEIADLKTRIAEVEKQMAKYLEELGLN